MSGVDANSKIGVGAKSSVLWFNLDLDIPDWLCREFRVKVVCYDDVEIDLRTPEWLRFNGNVNERGGGAVWAWAGPAVRVTAAMAAIRQRARACPGIADSGRLDFDIALTSPESGLRWRGLRSGMSNG